MNFYSTSLLVVGAVSGHFGALGNMSAGTPEGTDLSITICNLL